MMRTKTTLAVPLLTAVMFILTAAPEAFQTQTGVTAIRAGRLVDPDTGTAATDQVILIAGGRITAVGRDVTIPAGANVIDLSKASFDRTRHRYDGRHSHGREEEWRHAGGHGISGDRQFLR